MHIKGVYREGGCFFLNDRLFYMTPIQMSSKVLFSEEIIEGNHDGGGGPIGSSDGKRSHMIQRSVPGRSPKMEEPTIRYILITEVISRMNIKCFSVLQR